MVGYPCKRPHKLEVIEVMLRQRVPNTSELRHVSCDADACAEEISHASFRTHRSRKTIRPDHFVKNSTQWGVGFVFAFATRRDDIIVRGEEWH